MKTVFEHINHIKGKPHHVRKRIAFAAAAGGAGLIALVWLVGSFSLGSFAIKGSSFADSAGQSPAVTTSGNNGNNNLAGAAAALGNAALPAHIEIVDTSSSTLSGKKAEQTTLPF
jgi:hypothetical protein